MNKGRLFSIALFAATFAALTGFTLITLPTDPASTELPGATVLAFGPDNVLFVGDSKAATVHAFSTTATELKDAIPYNMLDIDSKLAKKLNLEVRDLVINDMKIHPVSQEAYIAIKKGHKPEAKSVVAIVSPMGNINLLDVAAKVGDFKLNNPPASELMFWREIPASKLTITDMDYHDGFLYVAGIGNGEFASSLRKVAYPFKGKQTNVAGIEIYHAIHTQNETRAPIRCMAIEELDGVPTLIASYTCTPLVTIPLSEIKADNHITGTTIAELGYGNTPIDMITYMAQEQDGSYDQKLLVTQKHRSGSLISMKEVAKGAKGEGLAGQTGFSGAPAGLPIYPVPTSAILHIDNQNQMFVAALKRNIETGSLELVSEIKGVFLRLSEFISEYDFPTYKYGEGQEQTKAFHDMIKPMEGYPELTSDKTKK